MLLRGFLNEQSNYTEARNIEHLIKLPDDQRRSSSVCIKKNLVKHYMLNEPQESTIFTNGHTLRQRITEVKELNNKNLENLVMRIEKNTCLFTLPTLGKSEFDTIGLF